MFISSDNNVTQAFMSKFLRVCRRYHCCIKHLNIYTQKELGSGNANLFCEDDKTGAMIKKRTPIYLGVQLSVSEGSRICWRPVPIKINKWQLIVAQARGRFIVD